MELVEQPSHPAPVRLHVVTYNVFQARYMDESRPQDPPPPALDPDAPPTSVPHRGGRRAQGRSLLRDFATLPSLRSADVILLQEALEGTARGVAGLDTVATLARSLGVDAAATGVPYGASHTSFVGSVDRGHQRWGLGVVSRIPARFTPVPLPNAWWSPWPRSALVAEIGPWILITLHLEVWPVAAGARRRQMQAVVDALRGISGNSTRPVVVAGDFNCETGGPHQVLRRNGFDSVEITTPTWSFGPLALRLDHVYVRNATVVASGVERQARGSDHRPLWVDVEHPHHPVRRS